MSKIKSKTDIEPLHKSSNYVIPFGHYKGQRLGQIPLSSVKGLNVNAEQKDLHFLYAITLREIQRRTGQIDLRKVDIEISGHAIDRVSTRCMDLWKLYRLNADEGIHSWITRMADEALKQSKTQRLTANDRITVFYRGMNMLFTFTPYKTLITVTR